MHGGTNYEFRWGKRSGIMHATRIELYCPWNSPEMKRCTRDGLEIRKEDKTRVEWRVIQSVCDGYRERVP
jgi:molybdopterin biosynthesis enzyme